VELFRERVGEAGGEEEEEELEGEEEIDRILSSYSFKAVQYCVHTQF